MIGNSEPIENRALAGFAADNGVAVALVNAASHEVTTFNNNSICRKLNPTGDFSPECAKFCGKAFAEATKAGKTVGYVCHAGLECRAVRISRGLVAIAGRTFVKAENYRKATERAISGDWKSFLPAEFFGNILLTSSPTFLDELAVQIAKRSAKTAKPALPPKPDLLETEPLTLPPETDEAPAAEADETVAAEAEEQPVIEVAAEPPAAAIEPAKSAAVKQTNGRRGAKASAWRSFFGSLLKQDHAAATNAILEFIAHQYGFSALIWLERRDNKFENTATYGEMKNRRVRLGIEPDDHRLIEAGRNEMPLELGERGKGDNESRTMYMFPIGVGGEVTAAIAVLDPIEGDSRKRQIARVCLSLGPQLEILSLRSEVARRESLDGAVRRFSDSIKRIDADDFWFSLTKNAAEMLRAERASLMIYGERSEALEIKAIIGAKNVVTANEVRHRVARIVFEKGKPAIISDVQEAGLPPAPERGYKTQSFLSCRSQLPRSDVNEFYRPRAACPLIRTRNCSRRLPRRGRNRPGDAQGQGGQIRQRRSPSANGLAQPALHRGAADGGDQAV
jgi:hypothetical protein